ncbi:ROK family protein [Halorientalis brevis]|uniref:ROK family protein n=1 Tax=Halorientalis brevis TaxID=1126241 RepID=A0ABD6C9E6_9EURY|nr:ROK family protein [Halorientalis brevis]
MGRYGGIDVGGTNTRAVVGDDDGEILATARAPTPQGPTGIDVTEAVLDLLREACASAWIDPERLDAVGVGSIGPLDLAAGAIDSPANLPASVECVPLTGPIRELVGGSDVYLHNDTVAGVIGERFYADHTPDDMVYLTISTGIGAGVCVDGRVLSGWDGNAGEIGHLTLDPAGALTCGCGRDGHWEAYCAGSSIPQYARHVHETIDVETALSVTDASFSAADLFAAAGEDPLADAVVDRLADWNTRGVVNLVHAYAPLVIYVGGAVALNNPDLILDPVRDRLDDEVMSNIPEIRLTTLGDDVVVRGALASAMTAGTGDRSRLAD